MLGWNGESRQVTWGGVMGVGNPNCAWSNHVSPRASEKSTRFFQTSEEILSSPVPVGSSRTFQKTRDLPLMVMKTVVSALCVPVSSLVGEGMARPPEMIPCSLYVHKYPRELVISRIRTNSPKVGMTFSEHPLVTISLMCGWTGSSGHRTDSYVWIAGTRTTYRWLLGVSERRRCGLRRG